MASKSLNAAANALPFASAVIAALDKFQGKKKDAVIENFDGFSKLHALKQSSATRWNKIYPYTLRFGPYSKSEFLKAVRTYGSKTSSTTGSNPITNTIKKAASLIMSDTPPDEIPFSVVLPIAPNQIDVRMPMMSNTAVTLGGIAEQHNGAPLRFVTIRGTTGVAPARPLFNGVGQKLDASSTDGTASAFDAAFGVVSKAVSTLTSLNTGFGSTGAQQVDEIADLSLFSEPLTLGNNTFSLSLNNPIYQTGYWKFHQLVTFFDLYSNIKKLNTGNPGGPSDLSQLYVVLELEKDQVYYQCTVRSFNWSKRAATLEYDYTIELVAWGYEGQTQTDAGKLAGVAGRILGTAAGVASIANAKKVLAVRKL